MCPSSGEDEHEYITCVAATNIGARPRRLNQLAHVRETAAHRPSEASGDPLKELGKLLDEAGAVVYVHDAACAVRKKTGACDKQCGKRAYERPAQRSNEALHVCTGAGSVSCAACENNFAATGHRFAAQADRLPPQDEDCKIRPCACACHTDVEEPGPHLLTCAWAKATYEPAPDAQRPNEATCSLCSGTGTVDAGMISVHCPKCQPCVPRLDKATSGHPALDRQHCAACRAFVDRNGPPKPTPSIDDTPPLEQAYWRFDALHKAHYRNADPSLPGLMSERDAFKCVVAEMTSAQRVDEATFSPGARVTLTAKVCTIVEPRWGDRSAWRVQRDDGSHATYAERDLTLISPDAPTDYPLSERFAVLMWLQRSIEWHEEPGRMGLIEGRVLVGALRGILREIQAGHHRTDSAKGADE